MAHFAKIENNIVTQVIVISNSKLEGFEQPLSIEDAKKIPFLNNLGGDWVQTSYNGNFRGVYAGIGYKYLPDEDIFESFEITQNEEE